MKEEQWRAINPFETEKEGLSLEDKALLKKVTSYMTVISILFYLLIVMVTIPYG